MRFVEFAERADAIEAVAADTDTVDLVAGLFVDAGPNLGTVVRFSRGRVFPAHDTTKLEVGPALCREALASAAGPNVSADDIEDRLADVGEIGAVAEALDLGGQRGLGSFTAGGGDGLTVEAVDAELRANRGAAGVGRHRDQTRPAVRAVQPNGADRSPVSRPTRVGKHADRRRGRRRAGRDRRGVRRPRRPVERAIQVSNDLGLVAERAREGGESALSDVQLAVGRPVEAMLAQSGTAADALEAWDRVAVEPKFDGARVQLHHDGDTTRLFSRRLEDVTEPLPEVVESVERALDVPAIVDGEVVAVDESGSPRPFQDVLRRFRRKHDVAAAREAVPVEFHAFDCLHADGEDLLDEPLVERHDRLSDLLGAHAVELGLVDSAEAVAELGEEALQAGHEGTMLKNPEAAYTPGSRGGDWLKRKPDVETLDLVVTGAEWGEGRRANVLGTFLLSVRDGDGFRPIGKVATGITDETLDALHERLEPHIRSESGTDVDIEPAVVLEVGYEEIQRSPTYDSGYALRFPRFVAVRGDKAPEDADSLERVERLVS